MTPFEILEHTADVGIRATAATLEDAFAAAAQGLAELLGAWLPGGGEEHAVAVSGARDREDLLALWLDEVLFLHEHEDVVFAAFDVHEVGEDSLRATARTEPRGDRELEGVGIKATTYHRLRVQQGRDGWILEAYLDV